MIFALSYAGHTLHDGHSSFSMKESLKAEIAKTVTSVFETAAQALESHQTGAYMSIISCVDICLSAKGRIVVTGIGKSALIGQKIVATLNSTGSSAVFMHAADAMHGDLGMVNHGDVILVISQSGESAEIRNVVSVLKKYDYCIIGMTGNLESSLARASTHVLDTRIRREADPNDLAPTTSATVQLVMGDALAMALQIARGFDRSDFAKIHPGGSLGKMLHLTIGDLIDSGKQPSISEADDLDHVIMEISSKRKGATVVLDAAGQISGIITDGDLRRSLSLLRSQSVVPAAQIMTASPITIEADSLAVEALNTMRAKQISQIVVTSEGKYLGMVHLHQLLQEGLRSS